MRGTIRHFRPGFFDFLRRRGWGSRRGQPAGTPVAIGGKSGIKRGTSKSEKGTQMAYSIRLQSGEFREKSDYQRHTQ